LAQPHAIDVNIKHSLPVLELLLSSLLSSATNAGVVDSNVETAELLDCLINGRVDGVFFGDVHLYVQSFDIGVSFLELIASGFEYVWTYVAED